MSASSGGGRSKRARHCERPFKAQDKLKRKASEEPQGQVPVSLDAPHADWTMHHEVKKKTVLNRCRSTGAGIVRSTIWQRRDAGLTTDGDADLTCCALNIP